MGSYEIGTSHLTKVRKVPVCISSEVTKDMCAITSSATTLGHVLGTVIRSSFNTAPRFSVVSNVCRQWERQSCRPISEFMEAALTIAVSLLVKCKLIAVMV